MNGKYMTVQEAADDWGVTTRTICYWLASGKLRGERIGRKWRIKREEVVKAGERRARETERRAGE
jgi:excisionase family DNA binding protein